MAFGHTWSDTSGFRFATSGLLNLRNLSFNTVDGFVYGIDFRLSKTFDKKSTFSLMPDIRYAFSRGSLMWRVNSQYRFNRMKPSSLYLRTGILSKDINNRGGINTFLNTVTSLALELNYLKLYESRYLTLGYRPELFNGFTIDISSSLEDRRILENNSGFSLLKTSRSYSDNIPVNPWLDNPVNPVHELQDHRHAELNTTFIYTPRQRYSIRNNAKIPEGSDWPTFLLNWSHGVNDFTGTVNDILHYDLVKFEVFQRRSIGAFSEFRWRFSSGGFLNSKGVNFIDFNCFNSQPLVVLLNDYEDAFKLRDYYSLSTPEFFSEFHLKYTTPYLLLKLLPGLSKTLIRENISASFLWTGNTNPYTEIGYSLSEFLFFGEIGVYAGFSNLKFYGAGGRVVLRFN
jgi:hypothetical protein